ncbi:zinc finger CCCH domain-containing protein 13-like isoform X1 [Rhopilema esculentum]|uniref:zinc finger CCCH domain-containing protein 13-like isoform X1 n=1 Tax=Rhopilema esculentum TaxID=499914 RepID=UPI0031D6E7A3
METVNIEDDFDDTIDLLEDLTEEELKDLNETFDPENNLLPIHERINYECEKQPSRIFDSHQLSEHLKAKLNFGALRPVTHPHSMAEKIKLAESTIGKDYVPFIKPQKDYSNHTLNLPQLKSVPRARSPSPLPDLTEEEIKCIENATEYELVEVAAQLKMNELVTAEQIESINRGDKHTGTGILRPTLVRPQYPQKSFSIDDDDDEEEYIDVDGMVKAMRSKGEDISIIMCNNQPYMDPEVLEEIAAHLLANKNIRHLSLANCNFTDGVVDSFAEALANNTKLETLNLESNFITPIGVKKILDAIQDSKSLREIRLENQYSKIGPKCEAEMAACIEKNFTLLSFGYSFETRGPRDAMNRFILRNNDLLRAARRNGEKCYNLPEQKRIIAKFRPPWVLRRPKRRGPDSFEGRKIVMRGDSKKKKKKGPAMMNEMLAKAAQVSKRWEDKEKTGELSSEFQRIEEQSKKKVEGDTATENKDEKPNEEDSSRRRRGRRNREDAVDEEDDDVGAVNGEEGRRRGKDSASAINSAEGMGAMQRRRGRRGEDLEDDDAQSNQKETDDQDEADGKRGKGKMDPETRKRAMRGGKVVEDEQVPLGAATRRRKKVDDDEPEELDFSQFEQKEADKEEEAEEASNPSSKTRIPSGRQIAGQQVASLDNAPMRRRRNKIPADDEEDLDAMLSSVDGGSTQPKERKKLPNEPLEGEVDNDTVRRRRRREDDEGESLDDILDSVPRKEADEDEFENDLDEDETVDNSGHSRVPSGKSIGAQPVNRMETASMKGRRRRRVPDDEEGESLDDLLKSVDKKAEPEEQTNDDTEAQEAEDKESHSRRESATKLPTGRQVRKQEVAELSPLSFKNRRRNKVYDDEEEDIDSLLSSVARKNDDQVDEEDVLDGDDTADVGKTKRLPRGQRLEDVGADRFEAATMKGRRRRNKDGEEDIDAVSMDEEDEEEGEYAVNGEGTRNDARKKHRPGVAHGKEGLGAATRKGRRHHDFEDDDIVDDVTDSAESAGESSDASARKENSQNVGKKEKSARIPKGRQLTTQAREGLGAVTMKDRRRRVIHDEEEDIDSILADAVVEKHDTEDSTDQNNNDVGKQRDPRIPKGERITAPLQSGLEAASFKGRRRNKIVDEEEDIDKLLSTAPSTKKEEGKSNKDSTEKSESFAEKRRRRRGEDGQEKNDEETVANGYQEDVDTRHERRRQRPKDDDDDVDAEKKRAQRRKQREANTEEKVSNGTAKEAKPAPVEEKKAPEAKKPAPVIKVPERPVVDMSKPMSLRERRRLKEQGLL